MHKVFIVSILEMEYFKTDKIKRGDTIKPEGLFFFIQEGADPRQRFKEGVKIFSDKNIIDPEINKSRDRFTLTRYEISREVKGL